jgi:hypothetical protein
MTEVVALFDSRIEAERAIDTLDSRGYGEAEVGFMDRQRDAVGDVDARPGTAAKESAKGAAGGAAGGASVGAGAALLASAGLALIPGIGPFLAAGTLAGTLGAAAAGAVGGAALGGVAGAIYGASTDSADETSLMYREGVDRGGALITVDVADGRASEVSDLLRSAGAKSVDVYGDTGWI